MAGWIKLHRKFNEWQWKSSPREVALFLDLLLNATHKETSWRGVPLLPGQVLTGRSQLAERTGLTEQQVRTALSNLKSTNEITITAHSKFSIITIVKWAEYQDANQQTNQQLTNNQPATNQQLTTFKNVKNVENVENTLSATSPSAPERGAVVKLAGSESVRQFLASVTHKAQNAWLEAYEQDSSWIEGEIKKAMAWIEANPKRRPKNHAQFMNNWLSNGWEKRRKTMPTTKSFDPGSGTSQTIQTREDRLKALPSCSACNNIGKIHVTRKADGETTMVRCHCKRGEILNPAGTPGIDWARGNGFVLTSEYS